MNNIDRLILVAVALLFAGLLVLSNRNANVIMSINDCVIVKALEEKFQGTQEQAWQTFAGVCAK